MTRSDIKALVLDWVDDVEGRYFTLVNTWINLAQRRVQMTLLDAGENYYMKPVETLTVSAQADYVLPSDFLVLHRVELILSGTGSTESRRTLREITTNQQGFIPIALGTPTNYIIKKDRLTLSPTPDTSNLTLRIYYSPLVADLSADGEEPDVPEQYHEFVAVVAAMNAFIKDDRAPNNLLVKKKDYEDAISSMKEDRVQESSRQVVEVIDFE